MSTDETDLINGRYRLRRELGRGSTGVVYAAEDEVLRREVAVKILDPEVADHRLADRFEREIGITARLQHPGIVTVFESGRTAAGQPCYMMSLARGKTLAEHLDRLRGLDEPWRASSLLERIQLFLKLLQVIEYAHVKAVVHRDIKPGNIVLGAYGEVWVLDWGLARDLRDEVGEISGERAQTEEAWDELFGGQGAAEKPGAATVILPGAARTKRISATPAIDATARSIPVGITNRLPNPPNTARREHSTHYGELLGTPAYMSPEQAAGRASGVDRRTDIYSLGAVLFELLTLHTPCEPHEGEDLARMIERVKMGRRSSLVDRWPDAPRGLCDILEWALATEPGDRYPDCEMFASELRTLLAQLAESYAEHERQRLAREREGAWHAVGEWDLTADAGLGPFTAPCVAHRAEPVGQVLHPEMGGLLVGGWGLQLYPLAVDVGDDVRVELDLEVAHGHEIWLFVRGVPPQPAYQFRIGAYGGRWLMIARSAGGDGEVVDPEILTLRPMRRAPGPDTTARRPLGTIRMVVAVVGSELSLTVDDGEPLVVQDPCPLGGSLNRQIALATWEAHAVVRRVAVGRRRSPLMLPAYAIPNELLKQNLFPQAIAQYRRFVADHPDGAQRTEARFMLCLAWLRSGQLSQGERELRGFLSDHLDHPLAQDAIFELARLAMAQARSIDKGVRVVLSYQEAGDFVRARFALVLVTALGERLRVTGPDEGFLADLERVKLLIKGSPDLEPMRATVSHVLSNRAREHLFVLLDREAHDQVLGFRANLKRIADAGFPLRGVEQLTRFEYLDVARRVLTANDPIRTAAVLRREPGDPFGVATWLRDCLTLIAVGCGPHVGAALAGSDDPLAVVVRAGLRARSGDQDASRAELMRCFEYTDRLETDRSNHVMLQVTRLGCYGLDFIPWNLVWDTIGVDPREQHQAPFAALAGWLAECLGNRDDAITAYRFLLAEGSGFAGLAGQALGRLQAT